MPVYNGEAFLREAMDSSLVQDFADFVLLVILKRSRSTPCNILNGWNVGVVMISLELENTPLHLLSVGIPARDEEGCICSTVEDLHLELRLKVIPHEIVVVDDGSSDRPWRLLQALSRQISELKPFWNSGQHGFGRAKTFGLDRMSGDAVVVMMADESDDCRDVVRYWEELNRGYDCVFLSRFVTGGGTIDYPKIKLVINRMANKFLQVFSRIKFNDTTNAFKSYRREVIDGCRPLIAPHFNLTVELPLKRWSGATVGP